MADRLALFADRDEAGRRLAAALERFRDREPLDVLLVRKIGAAELDAVVAAGTAELERRRLRYRGDREPLPVEGRTVIVVDDGIATGGTVTVAARALRSRGAAAVVLAVPVGPSGAARRLVREFDEVVCLEEPHGFFGVAQFYVDFSPVADEEVRDLLELGREPPPLRVVAGPPADPPPGERRIEIEPEPGVLLEGEVQLPVAQKGLVIFAHGSGSSRRSPRNRQVAASLNRAGFATLMFDLLTPTEAAERANVFDIGLLTQRLLAVTRWVQDDTELKVLPISYFGASTGAAAALRAAPHVGADIRAVVSRGGRPDLVGEGLERVVSPTLLIVGGADWQVLGLNEAAARLLRCEHEIAVVPDATHLFEEPGALDRVAGLAAAWFSRFSVVPDPSEAR